MDRKEEITAAANELKEHAEQMLHDMVEAGIRGVGTDAAALSTVVGAAESLGFIAAVGADITPEACRRNADENQRMIEREACSNIYCAQGAKLVYSLLAQWLENSAGLSLRTTLQLGGLLPQDSEERES